MIWTPDGVSEIPVRRQLPSGGKHRQGNNCAERGDQALRYSSRRIQKTRMRWIMES